MAATELQVRRFLPLRGGNMSGSDIDFFIDVATQWVSGYAGESAVDTPMGDAASALRAASLAQYQIDAGSGGRDSKKAQDYATMAQTILDGLDQIQAKDSDLEDVGQYFHLVFNPTPSALWPYRELDAGVYPETSFEDEPPGVPPFDPYSGWPRRGWPY